MIDTNQQILIKTKFTVQPFRSFCIPRVRLISKFPESLVSNTVLVSAPAGFGKSTLVSEYLKESELPSCWVSLDKYDDDLRFFLRYFSGAVDSVHPDFFPEFQEILDTPVLPPRRRLQATLFTRLLEIEAPFILVLDAYESIKSQSINEFMIDLITYQPKNLGIILTTRQDPPFPLSLWRASGKLVEIRQADLAFSRSEIISIASQRLSRNPAIEEIEFLEKTSEGWAVGLHLLLSAQSALGGKSESSLAVQKPIQDIQEFFLNEVLLKETGEVQDILLRLSIPDRFNRELIEALIDSGQPDLKVFDKLVQEYTFFVSSLDSDRVWYRFHHQFRVLLKNELKKRLSTDELSSLYRDISNWHESRSLLDEAIRYARDTDDALLAAEIVERKYMSMFNNDAKSVVHNWLNILNPDLVWSRPRLLAAKILVAEFLYRHKDLPAMIETIEGLLKGRADASEFDGEIAHFKGLVSFWKGETEKSTRFFQTALENLDSSQYLLVGESQMYISLNRCATGEKETVIQELDTALLAMESKNPLLASRLVAAQIYIQLYTGDLYRVMEGATRLQMIAEKNNLTHTNSWGYYLIASSRFHMGDIEKALEGFKEASLKSSSMYFRAYIDVLCGISLSLEFMGRTTEADEASEYLRDISIESENPRIISVAQSCRARILLFRGDIRQANEIQKSFVSSADLLDTFFWIEAPLITVVRILIRLNFPETLEKAHRNILLLLETTRQYNLKCQIVDLLVLESLVLEKSGNGVEADKVFLSALHLGVEGKWVRPFVEPGKDLLPLIDRVDPEPVNREYYAEILNAVRHQRDIILKPVQTAEKLVTELTNRELDVLELMVRRMQDKEIADELSISVQTVRTHLKHLFAKLDVRGRRNAALRAVELGLIHENSYSERRIL